MFHFFQRAPFLKRTAAWLMDIILTCLLAAGVALALSAVLDYSGHYNTMNQSYAFYENKYDVTFDITKAEYEAFSQAQQQNWDAAYNALRSDESVRSAYNVVITLTLVMITVSILVAVVIVEFVIPLWFGNGQTLGKKVFGVCLMGNDGIKVNNLQLLLRALLGKGTIETLIPAYMLLMVFWGIVGIWGIGVLLVLLVAQFLCVTITKTRSAVHDLIAGVVAVDADRQQIFDSLEELIEYRKKLTAEREK